MSQAIDFVIADAQASPPALVRIADVICLAGECACPWSWVRDALLRWPGCLVAVARAGDRGCVAAARGQPPVLLLIRGEVGADQVLGCAAVVYWLVVSSAANSPRTSSASGAPVASNPARASER